MTRPSHGSAHRPSSPARRLFRRRPAIELLDDRILPGTVLAVPQGSHLLANAAAGLFGAELPGLPHGLVSGFTRRLPSRPAPAVARAPAPVSLHFHTGIEGSLGHRTAESGP